MSPPSNWPAPAAGRIPISIRSAVLIENNVIALKGPTPISFDLSAMVSCVNNLTPQGTLIPATNRATGRAGAVYFPAAEEALVMAML